MMAYCFEQFFSADIFIALQIQLTAFKFNNYQKHNRILNSQYKKDRKHDLNNNVPITFSKCTQKLFIYCIYFKVFFKN